MRNSIPKVAALIILLFGVLDIVSVFFIHFPRRMMFIEQFIPLYLIHASRTFILLFGFFLIYLSRGIWQRKRRAWTLSMVILLASAVFQLFRGFHFEEALLLMLPLLLLTIFRKMFYVESGRWELVKGFKTTFFIMVFLLIYAFFGFFLFDGNFSQHVSLKTITADYLWSIFGIGQEQLKPETRLAWWFVDSITVVGITAFILSFGIIFIPVLYVRVPTESDRERARKMVLEKSSDALAYLTVMKDKLLYFSPEYEGFIAYVIRNNVAMVLGDPVVDAAYFPQMLNSFRKEMKGKGLLVGFYNVPQDSTAIYEKLGFKKVKIGEEAVIKTADFNIATPAMKDIRYGINRMAREGVQYRWYKLPQIPWQLVNGIDRLHQEWLDSKKSSALTFSLDFYPFPVEERAYVLTVNTADSRLIGVFSFYPYGRGKGMCLDLMLRDAGAFSGMVDAAIAESVRFFREQGVEEVSLATAPLSDTQRSRHKDALGKSIDFIFNNLNRFYGYKSLFDFKSKFQPVWRHRYLMFETYAELPQVTLALLQAHIKEKGLARWVWNNVI